MADPNKQDFEDEADFSKLRFAKEQGVFDRSLIIRLILLYVFGGFLFFLIHFQAVLVEIVDVGTKAKKYVVAQVDFSFADEEATIILKQQKLQGLPSMYKIQEDEVYQKLSDFQKYLTHQGAQEWEELGKKSQDNDHSLALSLFQDHFTLSRFVDMRTLRRIQEIPEKELPTAKENFYVWVPPEDRLISKLPQQFWTAFRKNAYSNEKISPQLADFIIHYFEKIDWVFAVDQGLEYSIKKLLQKQVQEKQTQVKAGDRILEKGELVTVKHVQMLNSMKAKINRDQNRWHPLTILGTALICLLFIGIGGIYLYQNHPDIYRSNKKLALVITIFILNMILAKLAEVFLLEHHYGLLDTIKFPLFVPFSAILLASLLNFRFAAFAILFLSMIFAISFAVDVIPFLVINILTGMVALMSTQSIRRRKEIFFVSGKAWLSSIVVIIAFNFYHNTALSEVLFADLLSTFAFMVVTSILVIGILPMLESLFQIMTDITLMEFMDPGNELLRRLTIEAPGTYQHSMVVGNLSEAAASAINANGLFCRVSTQYHDIGKLVNPQYFTENQLGGMDMHQLLTPLESAQVIISHVSEGVALARKARLPEQFIDIIKEHHGTTLVYYFYYKQIELKGGDKSLVDEKDFRYSGPKPRSKESTIIMLADSLEAASRSLDSFNQESLTDLIESLISMKVKDGQFDDSMLTFQELKIVKTVLIKILLAASHPRIKYPSHHPGEEG